MVGSILDPPRCQPAAPCPRCSSSAVPPLGNLPTAATGSSRNRATSARWSLRQMPGCRVDDPPVSQFSKTGAVSTSRMLRIHSSHARAVVTCARDARAHRAWSWHGALSVHGGGDLPRRQSLAARRAPAHLVALAGRARAIGWVATRAPKDREGRASCGMAPCCPANCSGTTVDGRRAQRVPREDARWPAL